MAVFARIKSIAGNIYMKYFIWKLIVCSTVGAYGLAIKDTFTRMHMPNVGDITNNKYMNI